MLSSQAVKKEGDLLLSPPKRNLVNGINRKKCFIGREPFFPSICFFVSLQTFRFAVTAERTLCGWLSSSQETDVLHAR